jgi:hypothetical protein
MPTKQWRAEWDGHSIILVDSWSMGFSSGLAKVKLYIDDLVVDVSTIRFSDGQEPSVRGAFIFEGECTYKVEGFVKSGLLKVFGKVCVDGVYLAGDVF